MAEDDCLRTVPELLTLTRLGLAFERKQIPQVVENIKNQLHGMEPLEGSVLRPRQVRYQAALRPDFEEPLVYCPFPTASQLPYRNCRKKVAKPPLQMACRKTLPSLAARFNLRSASRFICSFTCEYFS